MKQQQLGKSLICLDYLLAKARVFHYRVGRGAGVGRGRGVDVGLCVGDGVGVRVEVGVAVGVGVGSPLPPQTIISLPVQTAVCP